MTSTSAAEERLTGDAGFSLIEVLMAVILVGTAFVAILGGLRMLLLGSSINRQHAQAEAIAVSAAEELKAVDHAACAGATDAGYLAAVRSPNIVIPDGWDAQSAIRITQVQYWDGSGWGSTCYDANGLHLQRVTVEVESPDGRATENIEVLKGPRPSP
jgi:prepilin-type N-terminal cleavage/methylation domain-containing protein